MTKPPPRRLPLLLTTPSTRPLDHYMARWLVYGARHGMIENAELFHADDMNDDEYILMLNKPAIDHAALKFENALSQLRDVDPELCKHLEACRVLLSIGSEVFDIDKPKGGGDFYICKDGAMSFSRPYNFEIVAWYEKIGLDDIRYAFEAMQSEETRKQAIIKFLDDLPLKVFVFLITLAFLSSPFLFIYCESIWHF